MFVQRREGVTKIACYMPFHGDSKPKPTHHKTKERASEASHITFVALDGQYISPEVVLTLESRYLVHSGWPVFDRLSAAYRQPLVRFLLLCKRRFAVDLSDGTLRFCCRSVTAAAF